MPALSIEQAATKLARAVEKAKPSTVGEIFAELFPEKTSSTPPPVEKIAQYIEGGLEAEEIVDLWNVVFPEDHDVYYNEETKAIHFNEEMAGYAD